MNKNERRYGVRTVECFPKISQNKIKLWNDK